MDTRGMMGAAKEVWETLDKMQQEDPAKYQARSSILFMIDN